VKASQQVSTAPLAPCQPGLAQAKAEMLTSEGRKARSVLTSRRRRRADKRSPEGVAC
jgi:hypothetical protein